MFQISCQAANTAASLYCNSGITVFQDAPTLHNARHAADIIACDTDCAGDITVFYTATVHIACHATGRVVTGNMHVDNAEIFKHAAFHIAKYSRIIY
ncbi:hypothetical protein SDC9_98341 [bioreactor metagenome]|uniref:Uncharacterized protein n=1 Tax=bioreactor metagenome TaxID=1076179 RepID=A0A645AEG8_9ZZZZ